MSRSSDPKSYREWNPDCKVYIGNLSEGASKNDVEHAFGKYGALRNVWVARNPPGFAFVEYDDHRDAEDAVRGLDGTKIAGSRVRVEMSHGRSRRGGFHAESGGGRGMGGGGGRGPPPRHSGGGRYGGSDGPGPDYREDRGRRGDSRERVPKYRDPVPRGRVSRSRSRSPPPKRGIPARYSRSPRSPRGHEAGSRPSRSISRSPIPNGRGSPGSPPPRGMPRTPPSRSRSMSPARR